MITHFLRFADEAAAKAAVPQFFASFIEFEGLGAGQEAGDWRRDFVDGPVPIVHANGEPVDAYFLNVALSEMDLSIPGLVGAGYGPADDFTLVYGEHPSTPQRVFS